MVRRHVTHGRHTLADTGLDVDVRESVEQSDSIEQPEQAGDIVDTPVVRDAEPQEVAEMQDVPAQSEERELTGEECIQQYPGLWEEFNKIVDAERGERQELQEPGVPEEDVHVEQEGEDDCDH